VLLSDIHPYWLFDRGDGVELPVGRQVIPLLNLDVPYSAGDDMAAMVCGRMTNLCEMRAHMRIRDLHPAQHNHESRLV